MDERLKRVHVVGVRSLKDRFVVVLSDAALDVAGEEIANPDRWEVSWEAWVKARARIEDL